LTTLVQICQQLILSADQAAKNEDATGRESDGSVSPESHG
jgi:hypothetical protein